ncbi:hypothetical protein AGOR_G00241400 [Albula goreensis]|uniref:Uncharacterized protein n=1 Tax=Albula goreensis TaxID=1534307 RepID=A0A8T3CJ14_9TELE|nr:hypothetical protein AGOR_G00241400 [Albula goreensis]
MILSEVRLSPVALYQRKSVSPLHVEPSSNFKPETLLKEDATFGILRSLVKMHRNRTQSSTSFLSSERRRDSMEPPEAEAVAMVNPSFAVRRRFSGPLLLPPISRRHSTQDSRRPLDFEALRSPIPLIKGGARSLETVGDTHSRGQ